MLQGLIGLAGLGMTAYGAYNFYDAENQLSKDRQTMGAEEKQMLALQQQQKNLDFARAQRQLVRNSLAARATARSNAVASGSQFSTGLKGGLAEIRGHTSEMNTNINQNRVIANQEFGVANSEIDTSVRIGVDETNAATAQGEMQFGNAITSNAQGLAGAAQGAGGFLSSLLGGGAEAAGAGAVAEDLSMAAIAF